MVEGQDTIRLDKWLWYARFFKTRTLAAKVVTAGHVRVDGVKVAKPAQTIAPGATLTFTQANDIRVIEVAALGSRRGPAPEAQALYNDLSPPTPKSAAPSETPRQGRPSKQDRRKIIAFKAGGNETIS